MEDVNNIRDRITECKLNINRIPSKTYKEFKAYSDEEFCGDYGMCMKYVWDTFKGLLPTGNEDIIMLHEEISYIKSELEKLKKELIEKKKTDTTIDGRRIE